MYLKEKLEETLLYVRSQMLKEYRLNKIKALSEIRTAKYFQKMFDRFGKSIGGKISSFLSTGKTPILILKHYS